VRSKRVTSQDVADEAGVSRTTVSLVLNKVQGTQISQETRQRVEDAAERLGYVPDAAARALASRRSQIIGLVLIRDPHHRFSDVFVSQILDGLLEVVHRHDMRLLFEIVEPRHQKQAYLQLMRAKHIDGVVLSGPRYDDQALQAFQEDGAPLVLMGMMPDSDLYSVDIDNRAASLEAVEHLLAIGHKHIACITNADVYYTASTERLAGYRQALENAGIAYDPVLVRYGDFDSTSGYTQMGNLLDSGENFSAAFVASDEVALGAKAAIRQRGLSIPEDIALMGFDDLPIAAYLDPPMTTIHVPAIEIARQAGEMVIQMLDGEEPTNKQLILATQLIVRDSCGANKTKN